MPLIDVKHGSWAVTEDDLDEAYGDTDDKPSALLLALYNLLSFVDFEDRLVSLLVVDLESFLLNENYLLLIKYFNYNFHVYLKIFL